jgi:hypothetical protein
MENAFTVPERSNPSGARIEAGVDVVVRLERRRSRIGAAENSAIVVQALRMRSGGRQNGEARQRCYSYHPVHDCTRNASGTTLTQSLHGNASQR